MPGGGSCCSDRLEGGTLRVVYIVGASHSGSTLLDMMLNAHPDIISVGEVLKLNEVKRSRSGKLEPTKCSCGAIGLSQCAFWSRVNQQILRTHGRSIAELDVNDYRELGGADANAILFEAIHEVSGKKIIVDSSKMPKRLGHLMRVEGLEVYPIHLIRDPRGVISSVFAKKGLMRSILHYEIVHAQTRTLLRSVPHTTIRYEDLVTEPEATIDTILEPLGLRFNPGQLRWAEQVKHSFAGNHVRLERTSELVLDQRWKERLSPAQRLLINIGTTMSRALPR